MPPHVLCHGNLDLIKKGFFLQAEEKALKKVRRKIKNKVSIYIYLLKRNVLERQ